MVSQTFYNLPDIDGQTLPENRNAPNFSDKIQFPVLSDKAFYGLAGAAVKIIEPHTEADNAALLIQLLAGFGNLIGKTAYFKIGADLHFTKIFAVLVGVSSRGRKGTSWNEIERLLIRTDTDFINCIQNGLSSGEGLIYHVRDEQTAKKPIRKGGRIIDYQEEIVDEGAKEKRAFVIEPEFARVLKVISREGNTLSSVIRQSWDTDRLSVMTKNPIKATNAHVSIVGHITDTELIRNLEETETANGFANRFLWLCVRRSKYLPDGGNLAASDLNDIIEKLNSAVHFSRNTQEIKRDSQANNLWHQVYKKLSDGYGGLLGSVTSRATAQVMRLACLYALLDQSDLIRLEHLRAALALWQYCEDSAKYIFGMSIGDKVADEIFSTLRKKPDGLSKTEISSLFNRNRTAKEIETALQILLDLERIEKVEIKTSGRPREVFKVKTFEKDNFSSLDLTIDNETSPKNETCPDCQEKLVPYQDKKMCEICLFTTN